MAATCIACGKTSLMPEYLDEEVPFCFFCSMKIELKQWNGKTKLYRNAQEVFDERQRIIANANMNQFSQDAIEAIERHFSSEQFEGYMYGIDGTVGQILKVYEDHCTVTTSEAFNTSEIAKKHGAMYRDTKPANNVLDQLAQAVDSVATEFTGKAKFPVFFGEKRVSYEDYDHAENYCNPRYGIGCLIIRKNEIDSNNSQDIYFFYNSSMVEEMDPIYSSIEKNIHSFHPKKKGPVHIQKEKTSAPDPIAEIRKYKELLDEGIITQEEYAAKKKQLMNL